MHSWRALYHERDVLRNTNVISFTRTITVVKTFAERLTYARELRALTQQEVARQVGCSQGTIGNLESGARLNARYLIPLSRALGVSADWLYDGRGEIPRRDEIRTGENLTAAHYHVGWPFSNISPEDYFEKLTEYDRGRVEGFAVSLLGDGIPNKREANS